MNSIKVTVPVIVEDRKTQNVKGMVPRSGLVTEIVEIVSEAFFLDGPVSSRVAVLDFDESGDLLPGVPFVLYLDPDTGEERGRYTLPPDPRGLGEHDDNSREFAAVSVFGIVHKAIAMFEDTANLGRRIAWAFEGPQLLVVPQAGKWKNAFYERSSRSLQFFYFPDSSEKDENAMIRTALSHDIVSHETAHAILDGIAPDLYDALTPQSLALHEAVADLTALFMAIQCAPLRRTVLRQGGGHIANSAFSAIAGEFGSSDASENAFRPLRRLDNRVRMQDLARKATEPHALSEVLTGALFEVLEKLYARRKAQRKMAEPDEDPENRANYALLKATEQIMRMLFRALDYLPPGEISFADYGRAIYWADWGTHYENPVERNHLTEVFVRRGIVSKAEDISQDSLIKDGLGPFQMALYKLDLERFLESDWLAYDFLNAHRDYLGIPQGVEFEVRPRLVLHKKIFHGEAGSVDSVREVIVKVAWKQLEEDGKARGRLRRRWITVGFSLVIAWAQDDQQLSFYLSSDRDPGLAEQRGEMLRKLDELGLVQVGAAAQQAIGAVTARVYKGGVELRNIARMLHLSDVDRPHPKKRRSPSAAPIKSANEPAPPGGQPGDAAALRPKAPPKDHPGQFFNEPTPPFSDEDPPEPDNPFQHGPVAS